MAEKKISKKETRLSKETERVKTLTNTTENAFRAFLAVFLMTNYESIKTGRICAKSEEDKGKGFGDVKGTTYTMEDYLTVGYRVFIKNEGYTNKDVQLS